jgi:polyisoprenoid-binding protein YceI
MRLTFLRPLTLAAALALTMVGNAGAAQYTSMNGEDSRIVFRYSQMGVSMDGRFAELKATDFNFDPESPEAARVAIQVGLASIDAGYPEANAELRKDEWLALSAHPVATFKSSKVTPLGEQRYEVTGDLTIKGKTRQVTAPFTFREEGGSGIFEGSLTFQRDDFAVGEGQWKDFSIVANEIEIQFRVVAGS